MKLLAAGLGLGLGLVGAEVGLRLGGHGPWRHATVDRNEPTTHEPDALLGWRNAAGRHVIPAWADGSPDVVMTFLEDGSRVSAPPVGAGAPSGPELLLLGGSFTRGAAVSDAEAFAWKLQASRPDVRVRNFGTGGFGTYQSLLVLERELADGPAPHAVLYGYIDHHQVRNVAAPDWLRMLNWYSRRGMVELPFATLDSAGRLVRHPAARWPRWPLREWSATATLLERGHALAASGDRGEQARAVTEALLLAMRDACAARGAPFVLVVLNARDESKSRLLAFAADGDFAAADCAVPYPREMAVPGEGVHPNGRVHSAYADCIEQALAVRGI